MKDTVVRQLFKKYTFVLFVLLFCSNAIAQSFFTPGAWKRYRHEWQFAIGASNFLGELGGKDQIGTNFLKDWEISQVRYAGRVAYAYYLSPSWTYRSSFNFGLVAGNDNTTKEPYRHNRNLSFRSAIFEFSQNVQFIFIREKLGNKYGLKNIKGRKIGAKSRSIGWYLTAGVGVFYYNPQAKYNGAYVNLHDLHTEGQGLPGGPTQYKRVGIDIPVGFGARKAFNRQWGMYMEFTQHYTFTDYIDDVSTIYYNKTDLSTNYGAASAAMSDPNVGELGAYVTATGQQRGDPKDRDNYMFLTLGAFYKMHSNSGGHGKRKKIKALF